jgi:hypothetical protein
MDSTPIGVAILWFGPPPSWLDKFAERISATKRIELLLFGDAANFMPGLPVPRVFCTPAEFEEWASACAGVPIHKDQPRILGELRCMLPAMFPVLFKPYAWWGWSEFDTIWGDWDSYLTDDLLSQYDMISGNSYAVNGPFTIFRNTAETRTLYTYRLGLLQSPRYEQMDEFGLNDVVKDEVAAGRMRVLYPADIVAHDRHEIWNRCALRDGKLYRMDQAGNLGGEIMYFHFAGTKCWRLS